MTTHRARKGHTMSDTLTFSAPRLNASERLPYWVLSVEAKPAAVVAHVAVTPHEGYVAGRMFAMGTFGRGPSESQREVLRALGLKPRPDGTLATDASVPGHLWARWYDRLLALGADLPPRPEQ